VCSSSSPLRPARQRIWWLRRASCSAPVAGSGSPTRSWSLPSCWSWRGRCHRPRTARGSLDAPSQAAEYHFDAGDATRATALLEESIATAHPGRDRARILLNQASISWLDLPRVQGRCEQALQEAEEDAGIRTTAHEHLAWVGIYRGDPAFAAKHASVSSSGRGGPPTPRSGPNRCPPWHGRIPERPRRPGPAPACREAGNHPRLGPPGLRGSATARTRVQTLHFLRGPGDLTIEAARVLHQTAE
jgi:hypothetical protein